MSYQFEHRRTLLIGWECVPWLALSVCLFAIDNAQGLPRLGVAVHRPYWEVTSRWLMEAMALGVVVAAAWSVLFKSLFHRQGDGGSAERWTAATGMVLCLAFAIYLSEDEGFIAIVVLVIPLFLSSFYVLGRLAEWVDRAPGAVFGIAVGCVASCVAVWPYVLAPVTFVAVPSALLLLLEEQVKSFRGPRRAGGWPPPP